MTKHAERLRLRLRLALFKVQTNQTNIPLSRLRISNREPFDQSPSTRSPAVLRSPSQPTLLPAPVFRPTTQSIRTVRRPGMLSSPPSSSGASPVKYFSPELFRTPALPRQENLPMQQTSSPPDSQSGRQSVVEGNRSNLSSSAVKGYAARSLLGLREERRS